MGRDLLLLESREMSYKKREWYDLIPPDNWFLLTPSFWAFLAGTLVGVAANLLTGILLREGDTGSSELYVYVATGLFFFSAAAFAGTSIVVENCRAKEAKNLITEIHERKLSLSLSFLLGLVSLVVGVVFVCLWSWKGD